MRVLLIGVAVLGVAAAASADPKFERVDLVSDGAVPAAHTDPNLMNPWGLASSPTGPWWVANNATGTATVYDGNGVAQPPAMPLVVRVPGAPTGEVYYGGKKLIVSDPWMKHTGPARFIFDSEDGTISAWSPEVPPPPPSTQAFVMFASSNGAIYKGLAIATDCRGKTRLYATDFHNAHVDVLDDEFELVHLPKGRFEDDRLPPGFAPFGIQAFGDHIFVTYALQDADAEDDVPGPGNGFVDEYDLVGHFIRRVASRGVLNSPWGLAKGPESFGRFDDDLLVGNFGDGLIHAFRKPWCHDGHYIFDGTLRDKHGMPIQTDGLWSIKPGNGGDAGSRRDLFFTAGINDEADGLFGFIRRVSW